MGMFGMESNTGRKRRMIQKLMSCEMRVRGGNLCRSIDSRYKGGIKREKERVRERGGVGG